MYQLQIQFEAGAWATYDLHIPFRGRESHMFPAGTWEDRT